MYPVVDIKLNAVSVGSFYPTFKISFYWFEYTMEMWFRIIYQRFSDSQIAKKARSGFSVGDVRIEHYSTTRTCKQCGFVF